MLIVIASRHDATARALVAHWMAHDVVLLTCEDLSMIGWRHYLSAVEASTAIVGGREVPVGTITGVLTRLQYINEVELPHIVPADRDYVAAEMTAFLVSWLSRLDCPILNRPMPPCLIGPNWRPAQWVYTAARLGMPVQTWHRRAALSADASSELTAGSTATVTVVGDCCFGPVAEPLMAQALSLARTAGVGLLAVHFSGNEAGASFLGADLIPD